MNIETDELQFDDLVKVWTNNESNHLPSGQKSREELLLMTKQKADTIMSMLARNFWGEIVFGAVACIFILVGLLLRFDLLSACLLFGCVAFSSIAFYWLLGRHLYGSGCEAVGVQQSIKDSVDRLESFERKYFLMLVIVCCVAFVCISLIFGFKAPDRHLFSLFSIVRFVAMLGVLAALYVPTRMMLRKLYGQHINRLKACLAEMEDGPR